MGQAHTKDLALKGWPAFLSGDDVTRLKHTHKVTKHVWGVEIHRGETKVAYAKLRMKRAVYQRVDSKDPDRMLKYPETLAAHELPAGSSVPFEVTTEGSIVTLRDDADGTHATYRQTLGGWWAKASEVSRTGST